MPALSCEFTFRRYDTRTAMGQAAAADVRAQIVQLLARQAQVTMVFAAAPSQDEFLQALRADPAVDFHRIIAFHMDEYVGLPPDAPQCFGNFLRERLFDRVGFAAVHYLDGNAPIAVECARYAQLLALHKPDIVCLGIGENGHIAFNDPHVADFHDPALVKRVTLDETCRMQQVHDGCFATLADVPHDALTLTIPALANAAHHFCIVPGASKAEAVRRTVLGPVTDACPASILRTCAHCVLYTDAQSGALLTV